MTDRLFMQEFSLLGISIIFWRGLCACSGGGYFIISHPTVIRIADDVKITGHNLKAMKLTLKPVNKERIAMEINVILERI